MTDVIQQAREALDAYMTNWRVEKERELRGTVFGALRALLAEIDAGHLIDTRRIEALAVQPVDPRFANDNNEAVLSFNADNELAPWECETPAVIVYGRTAAEALAAAEREAK